MGDNKTAGDETVAGDTTANHDSTLNVTAAVAAGGENISGIEESGIDSMYLVGDDDIGKLEQSFKDKMQVQQDEILKNAECMQDIEQQVLAMNQEIEGSNDSVSSRVEKFGVLNRSLEKLKADIDNILMQREHAQNSLAQLADKMAADQKLIEAEQKRLEQGDLSKEIAAYEKYLGITVEYENVKSADADQEKILKVGFPDLCKSNDEAVYAQLVVKKNNETGKLHYEAFKHEPQLANINELLEEFNGEGGIWKVFISKLRDSFVKQLQENK